MPVSTKDLAALFGTALNAISQNRDSLNKLDGFNGNHGDNMAQNLQLIVKTLQAQGSKTPADALQRASSALQTRGTGGSSKVYASGLQQAAQEVRGRDKLDNEDVIGLLQTLMASIPVEGAGAAGAQAPGNVLDTLLRSSAGQASAGDKLDATDLVSAGLAFLQAKQSGADDMTAIQQAAMGALGGGNPMQLGSSRAAAGGLIAQSVIQALLKRR